MAPVKTDDRIQTVLRLLKKDDPCTIIVLTGEHGRGKTWTARKVLEQARKSYGGPSSNHLDFGFTLWVSMNQKWDRFSLFDMISNHLILPSNQGQEDDEEDDAYDLDSQEEQNDENKEEMLGKLKKKIKAKLANKRYLLIMDGEGEGMTEDSLLMAELKKVLPPIVEMKSKILITQTKSDDDTQPIPENKEYIEIEPLHEEESSKLLQEIVEPESLDESQLKTITKMCNDMPDQIIVMANLLRFLSELDDGVGHFKTILEEIINIDDYQKATHFLASEFAHIPKINVKFTDIETINMGFECSWYSRRIFEAAKCSIHYNDLITYWMLEGCLGPVDEVDKTYETGHSLLLKLINLGLLTKHDDNFVSMNRLFLEIKDWRRYGFRGTASLGLENIFQDDGWQGVGKLSKFIKKDREFNKKVSGLLIDSHRLSREVPESLFKRFSGLRVLGLFNPAFETIPSSFSTLQQLNVLVIRACPFLINVDRIEELRNLIVLEITGATSLKEMPEALFKNMSRLRTISFSEANITLIPIISGQLQLRRVILRDCSRLEKVPLLPKCKDFELIDVSGCSSLNTFEDKTFQEFLELQFLDVSNTKMDLLPLLSKLKKLNRLLLSDTITARLRFLDGLTGLEVIDISISDVLKDVKEDAFADKTALRVIDFSGTQIVSFRSTSNSKKLESIDLSNNFAFKSFEDASLEHLKYLRVLNVSKTNIQKLPNLTNLPNLCHLLLKDCPKLKELGKMEGLVKLEKIDLSHANVLETIQQLSQENLRSVLLQGCQKLQGLPPLANATQLEELDLSGCGKLQKLPSLANATKLKKLDLSGCESLTEIEDRSFEHFTVLEKLKLSKTKIHTIPSLLHLRNLEELDLSENNNLEAIQGDQFLQHMNRLQILNLSGIPKVTLASMSCLSKLKHLILPGCTHLDQVLDLEKLAELEILDLSQTKISCLPSLKSFIHLKELRLQKSHSIEEVKDLICVSKLEVLDLFGTGLKEFPYEISHLACLQELYLPEIKGCHVDWGKIKWLPEKVNIEECGIFNATETNIHGNSNGELSITVTSTKLFELFKKFQYSWETYFTKFQISVCSPDYIADSDPLLFGPDAHIFRDIYTIHTTKSIDHHHTRCLDIRGFDDTILGDLNDVLRYAEYVSITDNTFNKSLHNLGGDNIKRLWIERCNEMVNVFHVEKKNQDARLMAGLEVLCVSNMTKLKNILCANEVLNKESFSSLKEMYLDCCPELDTLFTSDKAPENLEIIDIKFCDKLTTVFGSICEMQKLHTLRLFQLPQLKTIGEKLKSVENLHTIRIEYCDTLETFSNETGLALPSLRKLHLESLPNLESIGCVPASPSVLKKYVEDCPQLKLA